MSSGIPHLHLLVNLELSRLGLSAETQALLDRHNLQVLDDLISFVSANVLQPPSHEALSEVQQRLNALRSLPTGFMQTTAGLTKTYGPQGGGLIRPQLLQSLASVNTAEAEILAVTASFDKRREDIVLSRWCFFTKRRPTYQALGTRLGVSRQRVSQLYKGCMEELRGTYVPLPICSRLRELIIQADSDASVKHQAQAAGINASDPGLRAVRALASEGLLWSFRRSHTGVQHRADPRYGSGGAVM